jgi:hypothetical protein
MHTSWQTPEPMSMLAPLSYAASDAGAAGVPPLTPSERATLHRIEHYVHSSTLRFAWVLWGGSKDRHFIVYDADSGCNEFYGSGERPFGTQAAPDCFGTKPPWMTPSPKP